MNYDHSKTFYPTRHFVTSAATWVFLSWCACPSLTLPQPLMGGMTTYVVVTSLSTESVLTPICLYHHFPAERHPCGLQNRYSVFEKKSVSFGTPSSLLAYVIRAYSQWRFYRSPQSLLLCSACSFLGQWSGLTVYVTSRNSDVSRD